MLPLHVVPELGPGEHGVTRENAHAVECGIRIVLAGESSSDDEELSHLNQNERGPSPAALDKINEREFVRVARLLARPVPTAPHVPSFS